MQNKFTPNQNGNLLITIGKNLRILRKKKKMTQSALAKKSGYSAPFLSQIENARVNINLNTLNEICNTLEVPIISLFEKNKNTNVRLIKRDSRYWFSLEGSSVESILINNNSNIELSIIHLPPKENTGISNHHAGDEVCYVKKGEVQIILNENDVYDLCEGDVLFYDSTIPHRWENNSQDESIFLIINSPATY